MRDATGSDRYATHFVFVRESAFTIVYSPGLLRQTESGARPRIRHCAFRSLSGVNGLYDQLFRLRPVYMNDASCVFKKRHAPRFGGMRQTLLEQNSPPLTSGCPPQYDTICFRNLGPD